MSGVVPVNRYTFKMTISEQDIVRTFMKSRDRIVAAAWVMPVLLVSVVIAASGCSRTGTEHRLDADREAYDVIAERKAHFSEILAGDVVSKKKPDPEIYNLASQRLGAEPSECVVVEDSRNGLLAAKAANMRCVVTTNGYTKNEDFDQADLVVSELGDPPNVQVTLETVRDITDKS